MGVGALTTSEVGAEKSRTPNPVQITHSLFISFHEHYGFGCICCLLHLKSKSTEQIILNLLMWAGTGKRKKGLHFGNDPDHILDTTNLSVLFNFLI